MGIYAGGSGLGDRKASFSPTLQPGTDLRTSVLAGMVLYLTRLHDTLNLEPANGHSLW